MDVTIYSLSDPRTGEIRYVGKTVMSLSRRLNSHINNKYKSVAGSWIKSLTKIGLKPLVEPLEVIENSNDEDWQEVERFYISYLRFIGCKLTNAKAGGMGGKSGQVAWNKGIPQTEEVKKKIATKLIGRRQWPNGRVFTEEHCRSISESKKGRPAPNKGRPMSIEQRKQMSIDRKGWPGGPSFWKGKTLSKETKSKMSESHKQRWIKRKGGQP